MIDLHSHILPAIDDGPTHLRGSIALAAAIAKDGTEIVAATPHFRADHPGVRPTEVADRCAQLNRDLARSGVRLRVIPGAEVDLHWALDASDEELRLASYGQRGVHILLETPYGSLTSTFEELVFRALSAKGYTVILAHPERSRTFQRDPARLAALVRRGVVLQITAPALLRGDRRSKSGKLARALLKEGMAHVLASDAHSHTARRGPHLSAAVRAAARIAPARAKWMVTDAPAAILAGEALSAPPRAGSQGTRRGWRTRR